MPSDRPAQLNRVVRLQLAGKDRRHLAVIQAVDGKTWVGTAAVPSWPCATSRSCLPSPVRSAL